MVMEELAKRLKENVELGSMLSLLKTGIETHENELVTDEQLAACVTQYDRRKLLYGEEYAEAMHESTITKKESPILLRIM